MPQRTNTFQRLITLLNATLAGQSTVCESAMLMDKVTGQLREVDILITTRAANYNVPIGVEVVSRGRPAGTPWVEEMRAKHANLKTDKLILVSKSGFTAPAIEKARFYNIETLTIEAACSTDWPLLASLTSKGVFEITTFNYECSFICIFSDNKRKKIEVSLQAQYTVGDYQLTVDEFVRSILGMSEFRDALDPHIKGIGEHPFWFRYIKPGGFGKIVYEGRTGQVKELWVGLRVLRDESPVQYAGGKYQDSPFVSGISSSGTFPLQFVLVKRPNGAAGGYLVDGSGIRALSSDV